MTTTRHTNVALGGAFRAVLDAMVDRSAVANLSNVQRSPMGIITFDVEVVESVSHLDRPERTCAEPTCGVKFFPAKADAKYHTDNCRLKDWRRQKKAEHQAQAEALIEAANEGQGSIRDEPTHGTFTGRPIKKATS